MPPESSFGHARDARAGVVFRERLSVEADANVLFHRQPGEQGEVLEDDRRSRMDSDEWLSVLFDQARRGRDEPDENAQQSRLAATRRTEHGNRFPFAHAKVDVPQHDVLSSRFVGVRLGHADRLRDRRFGGDLRCG
jgi:hypothetical protein